MKIIIDTEQKTINLEQEINLGELYEYLMQLFPNGLWKEFKLVPTILTNWVNPIIIPQQPYIQPYHPDIPWRPEYPWITYCDHNDSISLNAGIYCVQF
jgi:hypothetical protein